MSDEQQSEEVVESTEFTISPISEPFLESNAVIEEAVIAFADEDKIKETLGLTIAMVYLLDSCSDPSNPPLFDVHHIPYTSDVIQELTQFKVQLFFSIIDRVNSFVSLKDSQPFKDYVSALDEMWSEFESESELQTTEQTIKLSEISEEIEFHLKMFRQFLNQISCAQRALQLICTDCEKQMTDFGDIFGADILQRSLRQANDSYNEIVDRLSDRVEQIKQKSESNDFI